MQHPQKLQVHKVLKNVLKPHRISCLYIAVSFDIILSLSVSMCDTVPLAVGNKYVITPCSGAVVVYKPSPSGATRPRARAYKPATALLWV